MKSGGDCRIKGNIQNFGEMNVQENTSLKAYNTFGIEAKAKFFAEFDNLASLRELLLFSQSSSLPLLVIGGGSNMLLTKDFEGLVIRNKIRGIEVLKEDEMEVLIRSGSGEVWHEFVQHCVAKGYGGIENLSLIPGFVGASPMQNIGAYGVEIKDVFHSLEAMAIADGSLRSFSREECKFGYRESIFKKEAKGKYIIVSVTYKLSKKPQLNTSYGAIEQELIKMGVKVPGISEVSQAVINIRRSKLPDPAVIGNAGSFFKNPEIPKDVFESLKSRFPDVVAYPTLHGMKVAAGWLIEQTGWKGKRIGETGVHKNQALVLVNYGEAKGAEVLNLASAIQQDVLNKFGIVLEMEVNII